MLIFQEFRKINDFVKQTTLYHSLSHTINMDQDRTNCKTFRIG